MSKKIKLVLLTLASSVMAMNAFAAESLTVQGGTVNFKGSIVNTPCVVDVESSNQTVSLGQFQNSNFAAIGDTSAPVNFNINLTSCDVSTMNTAAITFDGPRLEGEEDKLSPLATEASDTIASGVGIQILQDSKVLKVNGTDSSTPVTLLDGSNKLAFQARYISTEKDVTVGSANSSADFTVTYN